MLIFPRTSGLFTFCISLAVSIAGVSLIAQESKEGADSKAEPPAADVSEAETPEKAEKPEKKKRGGRSRSVNVQDMTPAERVRMQRNMGDIDIYSKDNVAYRKSWGFRTGVTSLYPPFYEGWEDGRKVKGFVEELSAEGEPGYTLSCVTFNKNFYKQTGGEFINFFTRIWVPEQYAFSLFTPTSFERIKAGVREGIVRARKEYADRDQFETFNDYIAFKFGRDDEIDNFVDGFWIEANEGDEHLTYFYTSEFLVNNKKGAFVRPLIATTTYAIVRNKLLQIDIVKAYDARDDVPRLLEFTERFRKDMVVVNQHGESDR